MTALAAAPASGPIVLPALRAPPQPSTDRLAFAAMLDSLPDAAAKAGSSAAAEGSRTSTDARQDESPSREPDGHPMLSDGAFLSSLSFGLPSALTPAESPGTEVGASSLAPASTKAAGLESGGVSNAPKAEPVNQGAVRLTGARAFHLAPSTSSVVGADLPPTVSPPLTEAPSFAPAPPARDSDAGRLEPSPRALVAVQGRGPTRDAAPSAAAVSVSPAKATPVAGARPAMGKAPAPAAPGKADASPKQSATPTRAAAQDPALGIRKSEAAAPPSATRDASSAVPSAKFEPGDKTADGRPPDPIPSVGQSAMQGSALGAQPSSTAAPVPTFGSFDLPGRTAGVAARANAPAPAQTPAAAPVKEIDVDLSPSGLEDVSMTMRLAGDKLSVVIRAASSQTTGSIEGARDAIADRLAAIGQPLDSLIVRQTGMNADANINGNGASSDEGATGGGRQSGQSAGEQGDSSDASSARRGASRDRNF